MQNGTEGPQRLGVAGRLAAMFIQSKLTPLLIIMAILLGVFAVVQTPREEEPQIIVPMMDVIVQMPGASPEEVERRVTIPMEKLIWEIPGVEYVYSTSSPGQSMVIVRYYVGQDQTSSMVKLREKMQSHFDIIPPGASQPIIKARSIDDVPILAVTLHSKRYDDYALRLMALRVEDEIKQVDNVSETTIIGGRKREIRAVLDRDKMTGYGLTPAGIESSLDSQNDRRTAGSFATPSGEATIRAGQFLKRTDQVADAVVGAQNGRPVLLSDVASVQDGPDDPAQYVYFGSGRASVANGHPLPAIEPAVTISVAKRPGKNAVDIANRVLAKVNSLKGTILPSDVTVTVTRNYGETATEKSNDLLFHMLLAVVSVSLLIAFTLGRRESIVVAVAIPVTLALTLLVFYLLGYTLNRITLFALIFSIGILVDDAIVVVENIVRHYRTPSDTPKSLMATTIEAVDEVGNPTILATFTVIASILPLAFVGGLMGPYMRPIPVGASAAMLFSLAIAFIVTPYLAFRLLRTEAQEANRPNHSHERREDLAARLYRRAMAPLIRLRWARMTFLLALVTLLFAACSLLAMKLVTVKMLPFDNKNEFQVIVDMPSGATLEQTAAATRAIADYVATAPEVKDYEMYAGTASPFNFNGLVRHYFNRSQAYQADIQVNLVGKDDRKAQSHAIVKRLRPGIAEIARNWGARVKVAEVPPGPPVLETLVAEVYGPTGADRIAVASKVKAVYQSTPGVTDVDWYVDDDRTTYDFVVDKQKAALAGVDENAVEQTLATAMEGRSIGLAHDETAREDVPISLRLPRPERSGVSALAGVYVPSSAGKPAPLSELINVAPGQTEKAIYHKNLMPVVYVTGDVVGTQESPVYAILAMNPKLAEIPLPGGGKLNVLSIRPPLTTAKPEMKWDGEWFITYEVFRDMGIAFAAVMVLIYILVVAWFQSFKTPLAIMAPIPMTLIGILPAHAMMHAYFTATSMIGIIAGAGIITRNSIILVDFIELRLRQGMPLAEAVVDAGAVRFRPILLTAAAVAVGAFVILLDPIFQGLAISLMAGAFSSTLLSLPAVPILYYMMHKKTHAQHVSVAPSDQPKDNQE
ncbi:MAG: efflux RND transporter permease subunit [Capsulimonadaceae bacterium]|nr:efflux RND transporter permease subunit [Capsulimonadaceae bacterium]